MNNTDSVKLYELEETVRRQGAEIIDEDESVTNLGQISSYEGYST